MNTTRQPQQLALPTKVSKPRSTTHSVVRFGEGWIAPKIALHHAKEVKPAQRGDGGSDRD